MVFREKACQVSCQLLRERRLLLRGCEPHFRLERERRELLSGLVGSLAKDREVTNRLAREREKLARRETIRERVGIEARLAEHGGSDEIASRRGSEDALGAIPLSALGHELEEARRFELAEVIVELLAGQPQLSGKSRGGVRLSKLSEDSKSQGVQEDGSPVELPHDVELGFIRRFQHGAILATDK